MKRKVIIVAPNTISEFMKKEYTDWDSQNCETIEGMWQGLEAGELSNDAEIVILSDTLFDDSPDVFAEAVSWLATEVLVIILAFGNKEGNIRAKVKEFEFKQFKLNWMPKKVEFCFINSRLTFPEIDKILDKHDHAHEFPTCYVYELPE